MPEDEEEEKFDEDEEEDLEDSKFSDKPIAALVEIIQENYELWHRTVDQERRISHGLDLANYAINLLDVRGVVKQKWISLLEDIEYRVEIYSENETTTLHMENKLSMIMLSRLIGELTLELYKQGHIVDIKSEERIKGLVAGEETFFRVPPPKEREQFFSKGGGDE